MKKLFKKSLSVIMVIIVLLSAAPLNGFVGTQLPDFDGIKKLLNFTSESFLNFSLQANAEKTYSGKCGGDATWTYYYSSKVLEITGKGPINDYRSADSTPWKTMSDDILRVEIDKGITYIGSYAFAGCIDMKSISIPSTIEGIGTMAFYYCWNLSGIYLPPGLKTIGTSAFANCTKASFSSIPPSVTSIGSSAFVGCDNLWGATIPNGIEKIEDYLFYGCENLTSVNIPDSVISIGENAFGYCRKLSAVTLPDNINKIGKDAFVDCISLKSIDITAKNNLTIGEYAFSHCTGLKAVTIGNSEIVDNCQIDLAEGVFSSCTGLESVTIANNVTRIGDEAFASCSALSSVTFPDGLTHIGDEAFRKCESLESIVIPDSVVSIGNYAFQNCTGLKDVFIGSGLTEFNFNAFSGCTSLSKIIVSPLNKTYLSDENGVLFDKDKKLLLLCPEANETENYTIPDTVTQIGDRAFRNCKKLTSISIPESVTRVGANAFSGCSNLHRVNYYGDISSWCSIFFSDEYSNPMCNSADLYINDLLVESVHINSLRSYTFNGCRSLKEITFSEDLVQIPNGSFKNCSNITSVVIPYGVTTISSYAFSGCTGITDITIPDSVIKIYGNAFENCTNLINIKIPDSIIKLDHSVLNNTLYYNDPGNWESGVLYHNNILIAGEENLSGSYSIKPGTKVIADYAFYNCQNLTEIEIPDSVTSIGAHAFYCCTNLKSITVPNGLSTIEDYLFGYCQNLTSVTIPASVTSISENAFIGCTKLLKITLDENNAYYSTDNEGVLFNKAKTKLILYPTGKTITSYIIPDSVTDINHEAFYNCLSLKSIVIPHGVKNIGSDAFHNCKNLTSITIPDSVTSIGVYAFYYTAYYNNQNNWENDVLYIGNHLIKANLRTSGPYSIKPGTKSIADNAFDSCQNLTAIEIPDSVTSIGAYAFNSCQNLTAIEIPDSVTSIGASAFNRCQNLTEIEIPDSVTSIGIYAFSNTAYYNNTDNWENDTLYIGNHFIAANQNLSGLYSIKPGTKTIAGYAFLNCQNLTGLEIPDSVVTIEQSAFYNCTNLTSITIPDSVTSIGYRAFYGCNALRQLHIPASVTSIGSEIMSTTSKYICSDTADCYAAKYAEENGYPFEVCNGKCKCEHSYVSSVTTAATCTTAGIRTFVCSICSDCYTEEIPAKGHNVGDWEIVVEPTVDQQGKKVIRCITCGEIIETKVLEKIVADETVVITPTTAVINYGDAIVLHVDAEIIPEGGYVEWTASNSNFTFTVSDDGTTCTITPSASGETTFTATVYNEEGDPVSVDEQVMTSKASFFQKIIAFFKKLFGLSKVILQSN